MQTNLFSVVVEVTEEDSGGHLEADPINVKKAKKMTSKEAGKSCNHLSGLLPKKRHTRKEGI